MRHSSNIVTFALVACTVVASGQEPFSVTACVNEDGFIVLTADPPIDTLGFELTSATSLFEVSSVSQGPYQFILASSPNQVIWGALRATKLDVFDTKVRFTGAVPTTDISATWGNLSGSGLEFIASVTGFCGISPGDFNEDEVVDLLDIDLLGLEISGGTNDASFDLNGDQFANQDDLTEFLSGDIITGGNKTNGDADFNGTVAFADFLTLSANFGKDDKKWSEGDFVPNGRVEFNDFVVLFANFGQTANAAAVPEPSSLLLLGIAWLILRRRRLS